MLAMNKFKLLSIIAVGTIVSVLFTACSKDKRSTGWEYAPNMYEPIAYEAYQPNTNFKNGTTAQVPPVNTIPVGFVRFDYSNNKEGYEKSSVEAVNKYIANKQTLADGKILYEHFCSPCHGVQGQGDGLVVQHGYPAPPSYSKGQSSRGGAMKDLTDGKIYHTITYGLNAMGSYASQLAPEERWKVVLYVHQLQKL